MTHHQSIALYLAFTLPMAMVADSVRAITWWAR